MSTLHRILVLSTIRVGNSWPQPFTRSRLFFSENRTKLEFNQIAKLRGLAIYDLRLSQNAREIKGVLSTPENNYADYAKPRFNVHICIMFLRGE